MTLALVYKQEQPNVIKIEMTEGCNLRCWFCGMNTIRDAKNNDFKFMKLMHAEYLAMQIAEAGWNSRIEFTGRGEPTANPNRASIVRKFRERLPKTSIMLSTNGGFLSQEKGVADAVLELFDAGLNSLIVERYERQPHADIIHKAMKAHEADIIHKAMKAHEAEGIYYTLHEYPTEKTQAPNNRTSHNERRIVFLQDLGKAEDGTHSSVQNQCGSARPLSDEMAGKRCAKPFREFVVRHDMKVTICCNDWLGKAYMGDLTFDTVEEVWQNVQFMAARKKLLRGERTFSPCKGCTDTSFRVGLLPDKLGKQDLPLPTAKDEAILKEMASAKQLTPIARPRPWMKP